MISRPHRAIPDRDATGGARWLARARIAASRQGITWALVAGGTVFTGALAGGGVNRVLVDSPAWHQLGVHAWADYSRLADLGTGLIVYPTEGIGAAALAVAAALLRGLDRRTDRRSGLPIYLAALFMIAAMITTQKAAPIMLSVGHLGDDPTALQHAFDQFTFWGLRVRGVFVGAAFLANIWALGTSFRTRTTHLSATDAEPSAPH